jgi:uncharacterized protein (DUF58 family)
LRFRAEYGIALNKSRGYFALIPTGRFFRYGVVALFIILVGRGAGWSIWLAWAVIGGLLVGYVFDGILAGTRPRLQLHREAPAQLHVNQPQNIHWFVENRSPFPVTILLRDIGPESSRTSPTVLNADLPAGSRTTLTYEIVATQRGDLQFGELIYRVLGPLGLTWRQKRLPAEQKVRSLPHLANWKAAELAERRALLRRAGSHRYRWRGSGTIFESLREYSPEDDIRWVDWKATARMRRPISRNYETERHQQVILLVDASRMMTTYCGVRTKFDAVLEAAVLAVRAAVDQGDSVGLIVFSDQVEVYMHPSRERTQVRAVMDALYTRYPRLVEPDFERAISIAAQRNPRRSLLILFSDVTVIETARRMQTYVQNIARRHLPLVVTIADETLHEWELVEPADADQLYQVGVANDLVQQRAEILEQLRRGGAEVIDSSADQVATQTIERYLELKRRLRL